MAIPIGMHIVIRFSLLALLIAAPGLLLTGCEQLNALKDPTHRFVVRADFEESKKRGGEAELEGDAIEASIEILRQRLSGLGVYIHRVSRSEKGLITFDTSGENSHEAFEATTASGQLLINAVAPASPEDIGAGLAPIGSRIYPTALDGAPSLAVYRLGGIKGHNIVHAAATTNHANNEPVVDIMFDERGQKAFAELSADNVGNLVAIVIDGRIISAPVINEPILGGRVQISGGFSVSDAQALAVKLQYGALPADFEIIEAHRLD